MEEQEGNIGENRALKDVKVPQNARRVKVYEMRGENWHDCGTGYCTGIIDKETDGYFVVKSEADEEQVLLKSKIMREDLYQIQQKTLIVWQELDGTDIALSFQEAEGCDEIWNFLNDVRKALSLAYEVLKPTSTESLNDQVDEFFSDDVVEQNASSPIHLPVPELRNLAEIEALILKANQTVLGKENLAKFVLNENYIMQLVLLLDVCEDLEILNDLHLLCSIMKNIILIDDAAVIEYILRDDIILGVVGILEYDPDFSNHKANYREYLSDASKFKQVVDIKNPEIRNKIHQTFRLQYLKDVVLARIIDDLTFSILNTLIFFNQVDIIQHIQHNNEFLEELFGLFKDDSIELSRKLDAVVFIQQVCNVAKTLQNPSRVSLYTTFVENGLFDVVLFALCSQPLICIAGAEILMAIIEHDPGYLRSFILNQIDKDNDKSLLNVLINLLHDETDLGIKAQIFEAIRILMDPSSVSSNTVLKLNESTQKSNDSDTDKFLQLFYDKSAKLLFKPISNLDSSIKEFNLISSALLVHLCELLCFFVKVHSFRSKFFILSSNISCKIAFLFTFPQKYIRLASLRYFRTCIGLNDEFYSRHFIKNNLFSYVLTVYMETNRYDNLLSSACLEFFDVIRKENMKSIVNHLIESNYDKIKSLNDIPVFDQLIKKYEQYHDKSYELESVKNEDTKHTPGRWAETETLDIEEENYFNTSDDDDNVDLEKGETSIMKKLVDYPDDDIEVYEKTDLNIYYDKSMDSSISFDKITEKRYRDDDDFELLTRVKRNSTSDIKSTSQSSPKKISISIGNLGKTNC
ncbi:hypothetical protein T552_03189 [Pneumocystis carinii B80]|uniref:Uncharacterized protein n=1 Tax=Pneumocystis carinii (strain B80) TaxID=1408658 RepID=A0A0W4ZC00_PNEC8|nr:hypothetical protein T552_03189 [Pneumocystis carinii B80]KTW25915.1 hypothetical protein T552_03189 [Pneumocystis carinii B80]